MIKLYSSYDPMLIGHLRNALEEQGIHCVLRNEYLLGGAGDLPPTEIWPELWLTDERDLEPARRLLEALTTAPPDASDWRCRGCGERLEGQFSHCWRCGAERPEEPSP